SISENLKLKFEYNINTNDHIHEFNKTSEFKIDYTIVIKLSKQFTLHDMNIISKILMKDPIIKYANPNHLGNVN
ncbi:MAG: hypothetical protein ACC656_02035, partial [Candidatus Heimdallarchaeota archaeon]